MSQPNKLHRTFLPDWLIDFRRIISTPTSGPRFSISGMCQCGLHHTLLTKAKVQFAQFLFSMFAEVKDRAHAVSISHFRTCYLERFVGVWAWLDFPKTGMLRGVCIGVCGFSDWNSRRLIDPHICIYIDIWTFDKWLLSATEYPSVERFTNWYGVFGQVERQHIAHFPGQWIYMNT